MERKLSGARYALRRGGTGFTLVELLITLTIVTLLLTVGVGSFQRYIGTTRADTLINRLRTVLNLARAEAVKRAASVVICRVGALPDSCAGTSATGHPDWSEGWLLFVDADGNRQYELTSGDELLRVGAAIDESFVLRWNRGDFIAYQSSGSLGSLNGTFCLGDYGNTDAYKRELVIPHGGRIRATRNACSYNLLP